MGRRLGDVSPGTDPEYPYPMTPQQIGDGRSLALLGWGEEKAGNYRRGVDRGGGENRGVVFREGSKS